MYNIIIVGAKDASINMNNIKQASHSDLYKLKIRYSNLEIICHDVQYDCCYELDGIYYSNEIFDFSNVDLFKKDYTNIIIEFCNLLDENDVNKGVNFTMCLKNYKIVYLACGCSWDKGFPFECIKFILNNSNIYTPTEYNNVDSFLYTIGCVNSIYNDKYEYIMEPYLKGLYHFMGTLKWRGYYADNYKSECVLRELFTLLVIDDLQEINEHDKTELKHFISRDKHWNQMKWSTRENITKFIYGNLIE